MTEEQRLRKNTYAKKYRQKSSTIVYNKQYFKLYYATKYKLNWTDRALKNIKYRAKKRNLDFNLTKEDFILPKVCPVLGISIDLYGGQDNLPSVDRIDNTKGYIKGNVCIISGRANRIKSDASVDDLECVLAYMKQI